MIRSFFTVICATIALAACVNPAATSLSSSPSTPVTPSASAIPTATAEPSPSALTDWQLATIPSPVAGKWPTPAAVAAGDGRLVAVGGPTYPAGVDEGMLYGTIWTSTDGLDWTAIELDPVLEVGAGRPTSGPDAGFMDVAYGPGGFVVLGHEMTDQGIRVGIWRSTTGSTWERVDVPHAVFAGGRPVAVGAGGPGYVMVGAWVDRDAPSKDAAPPRAAVWTSPDGRRWTRVRDQNGFAVGGYIDTGETPDAGGMLGVTATTTGLVAVGRTCKGVNLMEGQVQACRPLLWTSTDALTWERIDPGVAVHPGNVPYIAAIGDRLVAVGGGWSHSPGRYVLRSSDGTTWRWDEDAGQPGFEGIVGVPGSFIATWHDSGQIGLSTSPDGKTWAPIRDVPEMSTGPSIRASDIVATQDRVVIVGWREGEDDAAKAGFAVVGPLETD
ncbi:MAG TPA: hypothetical protein VFN41_08445 [Candidatus Limnocylindrales bacterium]|nr:hypothetical protein [Candidatus Limnocylindrales bacterium]